MITISVIGSAMIATSMTAATRFVKLRDVRKTGDTVVPIQMSATTRTRSRVSQRASERSRAPARPFMRPAPGRSTA